jgi:hypothetical protein
LGEENRNSEIRTSGKKDGRVICFNYLENSFGISRPAIPSNPNKFSTRYSSGAQSVTGHHTQNNNMEQQRPSTRIE